MIKKLIIISIVILTFLGTISYSNAQESNDIIPYEKLIRYKQLFDPTVKGVDNGRIPVKIETVIGNVTNDNSGDYSFDMWIKGENCYYYTKQEVKTYLHELTAFPKKPETGQRIIYEIKPYADGTFRGSHVISYDIVEENVDLKPIEKDYVANCAIPYEDYALLEDDFYQSNPVVIETVVGCVNEKSDDEYTFDLWIKGKKGYHPTSQISFAELPFPMKPHYGQRLAIRLTFDMPDVIFPNHILNLFVLDDDVNVKAIEIDYFASLENDVRSKIVEPFIENMFEQISYKKILRDIDSYVEKAIVIEGIYSQELDDGYGLFYDNDKNYYQLYICPYSIKEEIIDFKLLLKDHLRIYGYIDKELYTYTTFLGEKTVPRIVVRKVVLLEED